MISPASVSKSLLFCEVFPVYVVAGETIHFTQTPLQRLLTQTVSFAHLVGIGSDKWSEEAVTKVADATVLAERWALCCIQRSSYPASLYGEMPGHLAGHPVPCEF